MSKIQHDPEAISIHKKVSIQMLRTEGALTVKAIRGSKKPSKGWDPRSNDVAKTAQYLGDIEVDDCNFGIHLTGKIVDVDIDAEDATYLIPALDRYLPSCSHIWGRKSRPRTHRLYAVSDAGEFDPTQYPLLARLKRIKEVNVEMRGGAISRGEYSLLPGSIHPSGEMYEWDDLHAARVSLTVVDTNRLLKALRLAGACAVLAPLWLEGTRQEMTMALAGFLQRVHATAVGMGDEFFCLDKDAGIDLLRTLLSVTDDDHKDLTARIKAFEMTWDKAEKGVVVTGGKRLSEIAGDDTVLRKMYTLLADNPEMEKLDEFCRRFAIWVGPALAIDTDAARNGADKPYMTRKNFASSYGHCFAEMGGKARLLPEILWSLGTATRVNGLTFEPKKPFFIDTPIGTMVNQWVGFDIEPYRDPVTATDVKMFLDYLFYVVASGKQDVYDWVLAWLADILKEPGEKCGTALVLVGIDGAGKSILGQEIMGKIIGNGHYVATSSLENVTKSFNVAYGRKVLVQCDEAMNSRQKALAARMKALITDPMQRMEPKGVDSYELPNHARYLLTSNEIEDAVYMGTGKLDRRYTVIEVSRDKANSVETYWRPFLTWLGKWEKNDNLAKIHRYLIDHEYDKSLIQRPIHTRARARMQQASWEPIVGWLAEMVTRDHPLCERVHQFPHQALYLDQVDDKKAKEHIIRTDLEGNGFPDYIEAGLLADDFAQYKRDNGIRGVGVNNNQLMRMLENKGIEMAHELRQRPTVWIWDNRKQTHIRKRVWMVAPPSRESIVKYLFENYEFEAPQLEGGDDVEAPLTQDTPY